MKHLLKISLLVLTVAVFAAIAFWSINSTTKIDFSSQVKPILNKNCIACHGGVKKNGGFSFLFREEALGITESGQPAIIPGHADKSEMIRRLLSHDPEVRMPYKKEPLSDEDISILRKWIDQGAEWGEHWAYQPVVKPAVPAPPKQAGLSSGGLAAELNEIDLFVRRKFEQTGLSPSPEASKEILLRRASLDLTGLPPSKELRDAFLSTQNPIAYEALLDTLFASPAYGERWASMWLDLARYADTKGYERDPGRTIWRYRDWLIRAFNADKPYDNFLIEQLAGDLLPDPTDDQLIATAFHRNTMTNDEGGTDNEEFRVQAVLDRVNTTWEALMGTTFACVQCHSHPYDPFRHEDYYKFMAFFNNTRDEDTFAEYPLLKHFEPEDTVKLGQLKAWLAANAEEKQAKEIVQFVKSGQPAYNSILTDNFVNAELSDTKWLSFRNNGQCRLAGVELTGKNLLLFRYNSWTKDGEWTIRLGSSRGKVLASWKVPETEGKWKIDSLPLSVVDGRHDLYFQYTNKKLKDPRANVLTFDWFYFSKPFPPVAGDDTLQARQLYWDLVKAPAAVTPIMMENPENMSRLSQVFERGNWLVKGDTVEPGVPEIFPPLPAGMPANRLAMAHWMVSPEHPLTARTMVNRLWEQVFGQGLAETLEDFGSQGIEPTHPELLDYLAWQFVHEYDWSIKKLLKSMLTSATYRQSAVASAKALELDPFNKYYARAPRIRLSGEEVRDQALAVSGLLSSKMYGPGVMPWQPEGIWLSPYSSEHWVHSKGEDRYRRAVYTYWKRTSAYPSMLTFDAPAREVCTARRIRTNTPLQALVTLNDSVYVEAAYHLALRMLEQESPLNGKIAWAYEAAMSRHIDAERSQALESLYAEAMEVYGEEKEAERHAMQLVAAAILNMDEFLTKN